MSDIEKTRQEALQLIEACALEMQESMRAEKPELAAAFGGMAAAAGMAWLLGLHKPVAPLPTAEPTDCRSPYCECEAGKCTHGRVDRRGEPTGMSAAARDVLAERRRQIEAEGWTPEHDDRHPDGELARAAACYALTTWSYEGWDPRCYVPINWPWAHSWWKPKDRRCDLIRAAALLLAEIERIDRAAAPATNGEGRG